MAKYGTLNYGETLYGQSYLIFSNLIVDDETLDFGNTTYSAKISDGYEISISGTGKLILDDAGPQNIDIDSPINVTATGELDLLVSTWDRVTLNDPITVYQNGKITVDGKTAIVKPGTVLRIRRKS